MWDPQGGNPLRGKREEMRRNSRSQEFCLHLEENLFNMKPASNPGNGEATLNGSGNECYVLMKQGWDTLDGRKGCSKQQTASLSLQAEKRVSAGPDTSAFFPVWRVAFGLGSCCIRVVFLFCCCCWSSSGPHVQCGQGLYHAAKLTLS